MSEADVLEDAMERIRRMPEGEEKQALITQLFQDYPGLDAILEEDMARADENADTEMPSGIRAGGQFVAASPLSHLSAGLRQGLGAYQQEEARDAMEGLSQKKTDALQQVGTGGLDEGGGGITQALRTGTTPRPEYKPSESYSQIINSIGDDYIPPWELRSTIGEESGGDTNAISSAGAVGMMQLMPGTGEDMGVPRDQRTDPEQNIRGGHKYLTMLKKKYNGDMRLVNAAYNWGMGNVDRARVNGDETYDQIKHMMPSETTGYTDRQHVGREAARARGERVGFLDDFELEDEEEDWMSQALRGYA